MEIKRVSLLMERKEGSRMEIFESDFHFEDLDGFKGLFIRENGRRDFLG